MWRTWNLCSWNAWESSTSLPCICVIAAKRSTIKTCKTLQMERADFNLRLDYIGVFLRLSVICQCLKISLVLLWFTGTYRVLMDPRQTHPSCGQFWHFLLLPVVLTVLGWCGNFRSKHGSLLVPSLIGNYIHYNLKSHRLYRQVQFDPSLVPSFGPGRVLLLISRSCHIFPLSQTSHLQVLGLQKVAHACVNNHQLITSLNQLVSGVSSNQLAESAQVSTQKGRRLQHRTNHRHRWVNWQQSNIILQT